MKRPLIAAALATGLLAAPALAASTTSFEMSVDVDRTALEQPATLEAEYERIEEQVSERCDAEHADFDSLRKFVAVKRCVNETMDSTVQTIDHADLTAFHVEQRLG